MLTLNFSLDSEWGESVWRSNDDVDLEFCHSGLKRVFPDLDPLREVEFRLYAQRPRTEVIQCDLQFHKNAGWSDNNYHYMELALLDESGEERQESVDLSDEDDLQDRLLHEMGLSWDEITDDPEEEIYTLWLRAGNIGERVKPEPEDIEIEDWGDGEVRLYLIGPNGATANVTVDLPDVEWDL